MGDKIASSWGQRLGCAVETRPPVPLPPWALSVQTCTHLQSLTKRHRSAEREQTWGCGVELAVDGRMWTKLGDSELREGSPAPDSTALPSGNGSFIFRPLLFSSLGVFCLKVCVLSAETETGTGREKVRNRPPSQGDGHSTVPSLPLPSWDLGRAHTVQRDFLK